MRLIEDVATATRDHHVATHQRIPYISSCVSQVASAARTVKVTIVIGLAGYPTDQTPCIRVNVMARTLTLNPSSNQTPQDPLFTFRFCCAPAAQIITDTPAFSWSR
jgi:hypothetical protein